MRVDVIANQHPRHNYPRKLETERGVYLPPSQFEAAFVSLAHGEEEIDLTLKAVKKAFRAAK